MSNSTKPEVKCDQLSDDGWSCDLPGKHEGPHMASRPFLSVRNATISWKDDGTLLDEVFERTNDHTSFRSGMCSALGLNQAELEAVSDHEIFQRVCDLRRLKEQIASVYKEWLEDQK